MNPKMVYANLEQYFSIVNKDKDVSEVPADYYASIPYPGGMTTIITGPAWAGALSRTPDIPLLAGASKFTLAYSTRLSGNALSLCQALEFDMMIAGPDGLVYNASCQWNNAKGGMWQIIENGNWIDTGFKTAAPSDTQWIYCIDWAKKMGGGTYLIVNGQTFPITLPYQPVTSIKWGPNLIVPQRQLDINGQGGAYSVDDWNISVTQE